MIINFSVENFRSIKEKITLSFEATKSNDLEEYYIRQPNEKLRLLKLGLIYGPNASGKTNILLALDFLRRLVVKPLNKKTDSFEFEPFLFDKISRTENTKFTLEFIQNKIKYLYQVELNKNAIVNEALFFFNPNKALVYKRTTDLEKQLAIINFGPKIKISKESKAILIGNTLWNNTVLGSYLKSNVESFEMKEAVNWFNEYFRPIINPKTSLYPFVSNLIEKHEIEKEHIVEILKKADFGISDIQIKKESFPVNQKDMDKLAKLVPITDEKYDELRKNGKMDFKEIYFQHSLGEKKYLLSLEEESAGTKRYYELSGILSWIFRENHLLAIDELEASLHPDLVKHFLLTFLVNAGDSQIIATSHFRELLMEKDILRNDVIWFTEHKEDGSTDLFSLSDFKSSVVRNTSSIYNAYKIGKLGATPDLKDYYFGLENVEKDTP